jgi:hypothetical protein
MFIILYVLIGALFCDPFLAIQSSELHAENPPLFLQKQKSETMRVLLEADDATDLPAMGILRSRAILMVTCRLTLGKLKDGRNGNLKPSMEVMVSWGLDVTGVDRQVFIGQARRAWIATTLALGKCGRCRRATDHM